ncbi:nucleotidyltransferase family protein [Aliiglaciecola lipolytica]|uniref:Molybdenum cofactor cytidylyltransferase n=1 Tax=Aliiglaciecola lipolytica E3 TaxID=1127673 RepID=K6YE16_9ALTE|nr:nucleotidyltransferase family protein [Aliiglaciecola lipolytica]GAC14863.1 molybdenum cofactor cytidylyltransferase [Aliiglaciecola lipolytica E3]
MNITSLLLAAGEGRRFGDVKQLADIDGMPMLNYVIKQHQLAGIEDIIVVLGANANKIVEQIDTSVQVVIANNWRLGMGESIRVGVEAINSREKTETKHVLLSLADQIEVKSPQIAKLCSQAAHAPSAIVAAEYANNIGVPVCFPTSMFPDLLNLDSKSGAKPVIQANKGKVIRVAIPEAQFDIDTTEDLRRWQSKLQTNSGE